MNHTNRIDEHENSTERMRTSATGNVEAKFTSLPWGDMQATITGSDTDQAHYGGWPTPLWTRTELQRRVGHPRIVTDR